MVKTKAVRVYTDKGDIFRQIIVLSEKCQDISLDTFVRIIPFGDYHKKDKTVEIILSEVEDIRLRRKMLRLVVLIPEKKSLYLAQKTMDCRDIEELRVFKYYHGWQEGECTADSGCLTGNEDGYEGDCRADSVRQFLTVREKLSGIKEGLSGTCGNGGRCIGRSGLSV